jgi:hypothetical protein
MIKGTNPRSAPQIKSGLRNVSMLADVPIAMIDPEHTE